MRYSWCVVVIVLLASCVDNSADVAAPEPPKFPDAVVQWAFPTINMERTYFMTLPVEDLSQWHTDAEAVLRDLFDAELPLETAWFNLWPSECFGHKDEGLIRVDLIKPDERILGFGFASSPPFWCWWGQLNWYAFAEPQWIGVPTPEEVEVNGREIVGEGVLHYIGLDTRYMDGERLLYVAEKTLSDLVESGVPVIQLWMPLGQGCDCGGQAYPVLVVDVPTESEFLLENQFWTEDRPGANLGVYDFWWFRQSDVASREPVGGPLPNSPLLPTGREWLR
jgi:hypothetical protein